MTARSKVRSYAEKRGAERANRVVAIKHRLIKSSSKKTKNMEAEWSLSTTKNMSVTGLLFMSELPYKVGDTLELNVTMSGVIDIVKGQAQVVRVHEKGSHSYDIAVKLVALKPRSRIAKSHIKG